MAEKVDFALNLSKLEGIIAKMEEGQLTLEQMLEHYGDGVQLLKACRAQLNEAQGKVEVLSRELAGENANGE